MTQINKIKQIQLSSADINFSENFELGKRAELLISEIFHLRSKFFFVLIKIYQFSDKLNFQHY